MPDRTDSRHPVLPAIADQNSFEAPARGEWKVFESPYLEKLGRELKAEVDTEYFDVHSIPDVWARPLLFQMALYDEGHPLHERTVGEWRGLAALVALTDWRPPGERLGAFQVDFHDGTPFLKAALQVAPHRALFSDTRWDAVHVLTYQGKAIGMTSPTTLLCTASGYAAHGVSWYALGRLHDPLRVPNASGHPSPRINADERAAVSWWLERLRDELEGHDPYGEGRDPELWNELQGQVQAFLQDLGPAGGGYALQQDALALSSPNAFRYLDEVPGRPIGTPETSDVRLIPTREPAAGPPLLILDRTIAEKWNVPAQDVRVWGGTSLEAAVPPTGPTGPVDHLGGEVLGGAEWRDPASFFLDEITVVEGANTFVKGNVILPRGSAASKASPLLPLTDELLGYLTPHDLAGRVTIDQGAGGGYEVALRLPLSGEKFGDGEFTVVKRYGKDDVRIVEDAPVLEVWPDFVAPGWDRYFTLFVEPGSSSYFLPRPVAKARARTHRDAVKAVTREVTVSPVFPEVMSCTDPEGRTPYGLLILARPPEAKKKGGQWTVGVDFGTTNTTVFYDAGGGPRPLVFSDRLRQVTNASGRAEQTRQYFFSPEVHEPPFRTLYLEDEDAPVGQTGDPVLDGHIMFLSSEAYRAAPALFARAESNLKWSDRPHDRVLARRFLEQVALQVRAEAVARGVEDVSWTYSVPTSFSKAQEASTNAMWKGMVGPASVQTESMATAAYFYDQAGATLAAGAVCLDVGGMSTDVAVWVKNETRLQTSVRLASRDILVDALHALPSVQHKVLGEVFSEQDNARAGIETALAVQGGGLWDAVRTHEAGPDLSFLRQQISLGFGGLVYYVGLLLRHLDEGGLFPATLPAVYVGGNGARMLHWVASGDFSASSPIADLFAGLLADASGFGGGPFQVRVTPDGDMKREVGHGLVVQHNLKTDVAPLTLAGEDFSVRGETRRWDDPITADDVVSGVEVDADLPTFGGFLRAFNAYADGADSVVSPVDVGPDVLKSVRDAVAQRSEDLRGRDQNDVHAEPLFVTALRTLLHDRLRTRGDAGN